MDLLRDLFGYLLAHRRYWLIPLIIAILAVGALVAISVASPLSPFIYPMF
ncbi:MAG TPA: DUF5989 family protein [Polyangiaceae bacterium]|jgi:hypothetical protein|nr:DUF5989 family protein [Polyangiaceae bacterium]